MLGLSGAGVVGRTFLSSPDELARWLAANPRSTPVDLGARLRGAVCAVLYEPRTHRVSLVPDPLGSAFVYSWRHGHAFVHSNDLGLLRRLVARRGHGLRKSLPYLLSVLAVGNGGYYPASYEDVEVLAPGRLLELSPEGEARRDYRLPADLGAAAAREALSAELCDNVEASVASGAGPVVAHLTGGFDSRLVLAALLATGRAGDVAFFCSGPPTSLDRCVADGLMRQYGLRSTGHPGFDTVNPDRTLAAQRLAMTEDAHGMLTASPSLGMRQPDGGSLILSGGYGGLLRSQYGHRKGAEAVGSGLTRALWGNTAFGDDDVRITSPEFNAALTSRVQDSVRAQRAKGLDESAWLDAMFMSVRNRYYIGLTSSLVSRSVPRFDPLYSPLGAYAALRGPAEERAVNLLGFDVMDALAPGLKSWEFDTPRFKDGYTALRGPQAVNELPREGAIDRDARRHVFQGRVTDSAASPSREQIEFANRIKANPGQVAGMESMQASCRKLMAGIGRDALEEHFNWTVLRRLTHKPLGNRVHIRQVHYLNDILGWYYADPGLDVAGSAPGPDVS
ncbi:hypothetical protein ACQ7DA_07565 [Zafaria sp. J156]|uniref:hypothetical protein n=1 Tax=Zafaria sp. J156 TaxID=3116490 RepID=UPI002E798983|nr:hypothetical protein [Zafaria sp. J156]MEE1620769.1 hypothetical protein [Zafaria sp. J156]